MDLGLIPKDKLGWINFFLDIIILVVMIYMLVVVTPEESKILKECNTRVLCREGLLKKDICEQYEYFPDSDLIPELS